ncbi:hypothetical protein FRB90_004621 [Tulasnella sp. 427]|nr:hypothetical protein FRB90_004621 [Tulasnella sp. 427]
MVGHSLTSSPPQSAQIISSFSFGSNVKRSLSLLDPQNHCSFAQLPDELIYLVTLLLSSASKAALLQTCRYFRHLLEPTLYRLLDLGGSLKRGDAVNWTLARRPDLILHVQRYTGFLHGSPPFKGRKSTSSNYTDTESYKNIVKVLTHAINIREIDFGTCSNWASSSLWKSATKAVFKMKLVKLTYYASTSDKNQLCQLLATQPMLEELAIYGHGHDLAQLNSEAVPNLKRVTATITDAVAVVPGRRIEELRLSCYTDVDCTLFRQFSLGVHGIRDLSILYLGGPTEEQFQLTLQVIGEALSEVERLQFALGRSVRANVILNAFPPLFKLRQLDLQLVRLKRLEDQVQNVFGTHDEASVGHSSDKDAWDEIYATIKQRCPSLIEFYHA